MPPSGACAWRRGQQLGSVHVVCPPTASSAGIGSRMHAAMQQQIAAIFVACPANQAGVTAACSVHARWLPAFHPWSPTLVTLVTVAGAWCVRWKRSTPRCASTWQRRSSSCCPCCCSTSAMRSRCGDGCQCCRLPGLPAADEKAHGVVLLHKLPMHCGAGLQKQRTSSVARCV